MGGAGCCDDKAFGVPCLDCAFDQGPGGASERPQAQQQNALRFGMLSARTTPSDSSFWKAAIAADVFRRAAPVPGSDATEIGRAHV